jgi:alginate O-acetyltransferase complex protein AlgI
MLVANAVAVPVDQIFALPATALTPSLAWLAVVCYTLQIYFDFSGYSDMAVGLGKMFGFKFLENFDFPYIGQSIRDFWHRWHISLSTWFRDYVYIPLGGSRCAPWRTHLNLVTVFFLCGLWHGASWTFVIWGLYHGLFLVLERTRFGAVTDALPRVVRHGYVLLVVMVGWVLFRADTFGHALLFLRNMAGFASAAPGAMQPFHRYWTHELAWSMAAGVVFSIPAWRSIVGLCVRLREGSPLRLRPVLFAAGQLVEVVLVTALLLISAAWLASGTYNPFIYFRF